jgi:hypothetical protein
MVTCWPLETKEVVLSFFAVTTWLVSLLSSCLPTRLCCVKCALIENWQHGLTFRCRLRCFVRMNKNIIFLSRGWI